jgi:hypothetical protein
MLQGHTGGFIEARVVGHLRDGCGNIPALAILHFQKLRVVVRSRLLKP